MLLALTSRDLAAHLVLLPLAPPPLGRLGRLELRLRGELTLTLTLTLTLALTLALTLTLNLTPTLTPILTLILTLTPPHL